MSGRFKYLLLTILLLNVIFPSWGLCARVKDIASIKGIRQNQLFGYGLVIGLNGSGDKGGTGFTIQGLVHSGKERPWIAGGFFGQTAGMVPEGAEGRLDPGFVAGV